MFQQPSFWRGQIAPGTSPTFGAFKGRVATAQMTVAGTGAVSCAFALDGSNDPSNANAWVQLGTATASGTGAGTAKVDAVDTAFQYFRLRITAISGTGATADGSVSKS